MARMKRPSRGLQVQSVTQSRFIVASFGILTVYVILDKLEDRAAFWWLESRKMMSDSIILDVSLGIVVLLQIGTSDMNSVMLTGVKAFVDTQHWLFYRVLSPLWTVLVEFRFIQLVYKFHRFFHPSEYQRHHYQPLPVLG